MLARPLTAIALAASLWGPPALAQVSLSAIPAQAMKARPKVAIPAYQINFIIQQQATAAAGIGARSRTSTMMTGVDPALMKKLTNEAYADFRTKLTAAGVPLVPAFVTNAAMTGVERLPGNQDISLIGRTVTIGQSVTKGWATFGADEAPAVTAYHAPGSPTGISPMAMLAGPRTMGPAVKALDAALVMPSLTIDFIDMEAKRGVDIVGRARASTSAEVNFSLRQSSTANIVTQASAGPAYPAGARMAKDVDYPGAFATFRSGGTSVSDRSSGTLYDANYLSTPNAQGDVVVVDPAVWEGMVRRAYGDFNAALVATIVKARS
jgi:hypothetical protein